MEDHASYLDGIALLAALPSHVSFVAKREFLEHPVARIYLRGLGARFVERFDARQSVEDASRMAGAVMAGAAIFVAWRAGHQPAAEFSFTRVAYRPAAIFRAAFAPDGKTVVYSASVEGNTPEIFTVRPEFPEPRPLDLRGVQLLSVSSKGELAVLTGAKYLAHRLFTGTLARVPLVGGAPREILENVREADWSPDGSELATMGARYPALPLFRVWQSEPLLWMAFLRHMP